MTLYSSCFLNIEVFLEDSYGPRKSNETQIQIQDDAICILFCSYAREIVRGPSITYPTHMIDRGKG